MSRSKIVLSLITSAAIASSVSAMEFQILGSKAASMGGAGIATSPSSLAAYNNPALLANNPEKFSLHIGAGIGLKDTGAGKAVSDLSDLDFSGVSDIVDGTASTATQDQIDTLITARNIIVGMDGKGFQLNPTVDLGLSFGAFGTGIFITTDIGAKANIDQTRTALIFEDSGSYYDIQNIAGGDVGVAVYNNISLHYAVESGLTNLEVMGLAVAEIPLAYGHGFDLDIGKVSLGGALKLMQGKTFFKTLALDEENSFDDLNQHEVDSTAFGVDAGFAFQPKSYETLTLALVGKNLNTPKFDAHGGRTFEIEPALRAGAAYKPNEWVELAFDADLTTNKGLTGYDTRYLGGGVNFDLSVVELNAGVMKNIASGDEAGLIYTAGVATGPDWLHFELSAQMASKTGEVEGNKYPKQASVNFAISSSW